MLEQLLEVLEYLHGQVPPVIHRDIKPANVMFRDKQSRQPALVDLETASIGEPGSGTTIIVSPGFTAPEQLGGEAYPASDLYSLGWTMLAVCTRRDPVELKAEVRTSGFPKLPSLDPGLQSTLQRLCEPSLEKRLRSATEALTWLRDPSSRQRLASAAGLATTNTFGGQLTSLGASAFRIVLGVAVGLAIVAILWMAFGSIGPGGSGESTKPIPLGGSVEVN